MNEFQDFKVDYHIHTTFSDGQMKPAALVRQAKELGFETIAITDHDNSSKLKNAINDKKRIMITTLHRFPIIYKEIDEMSIYRFEDYLTQKNEYICLFLQENHGVRINGRRIQTFAMNNNFQMQDGDCVSLVKLTNEQQIYYEA